MISIDGSRGEGGGQVLRTALAVSLATGRPFRIERIRAGRSKPGLLRQHLTAVQAAATISSGVVEGAALRSTELTFTPGEICPGSYRFSIGTAGSTGLVLQTVLLPLLLAPGASRLVLEGGTHNSNSPPFDFLAKTLLPLLRKMGASVTASLKRHGFYPAGGGRICVAIEPSRLSPLDLSVRGAVHTMRARALVSNLAPRIGQRELNRVAAKLDLASDAMEVCTVDAHGPGNVLMIEVESDSLTEVFSGFGEVQVRAEAVAGKVCSAVRTYLSADAPVGPHLADQLLLPMALGAGGSLRTLGLTPHTETNIDLIRELLPVDIRVQRCGRHDVRIDVSPI